MVDHTHLAAVRLVLRRRVSGSLRDGVLLCHAVGGGQRPAAVRRPGLRSFRAGPCRRGPTSHERVCRLASSLLVAVLAVVLAGKGMAALQAAGVLSVDPVPFPRIDVLGVHPSVETMLAQVAVLVVVVITYLINTRRRHVPQQGPRLPRHEAVLYEQAALKCCARRRLSVYSGPLPDGCQTGPRARHIQ